MDDAELPSPHKPLPLSIRKPVAVAPATVSQIAPPKSVPQALLTPVRRYAPGSAPSRQEVLVANSSQISPPISSAGSSSASQEFQRSQSPRVLWPTLNHRVHTRPSPSARVSFRPSPASESEPDTGYIRSPPVKTPSPLPLVRSRRPILEGISLDSITSPREKIPIRSPGKGLAVGIEPLVVITNEEAIATGIRTSPRNETSPASSPPPPPPPISQRPMTPPVSPVKQSRPTPPREFPKAIFKEKPLSSQPKTSKPNYDSDADSEDEEEPQELTELEERAVLKDKLIYLRGSYPEIDLSNYDFQNDSIKRLRRVFKRYKKKKLAQTWTGSHKKFLIVGFVIIEVICVRLLKIQGMRGLTESQLRMMSSYDDLMFELGIKYASNYKTYFPVEVRLAFAMCVNAIIFYAVKIVLGDGNSEISKNISLALGGKQGEGDGMSGIVGMLMQTLNGSPPEVGELPMAQTRRRRRAVPRPGEKSDDVDGKEDDKSSL